MIYTRKQELRHEIKQLQKKLGAVERTTLSHEALARIEEMPAFVTSSNILIYHSLSDELITTPFINRWRNHKHLFLPIMKEKELAIGSIDSPLNVGRFGIIEPQESDSIDLSSIDLVIVPGVAFDANGHRLGRGSGYYDRLLVKMHGEFIGVCFDFQLFDNLPTTPADVPMHYIVTPTKVIEVK